MEILKNQKRAWADGGFGIIFWILSVTDASSESSAFLLFSGPLVSDMLQPPISRSHQPVLSILESYFLYFLFTLLFLIDMGLCYKILKLRKLASACGSPVRRKQRWWVRASSFVGEPRWPSTGINGHQWPWMAMNSPIWCLSKKGATGADQTVLPCSLRQNQLIPQHGYYSPDASA